MMNEAICFFYLHFTTDILFKRAHYDFNQLFHKILEQCFVLHLKL